MDWDWDWDWAGPEPEAVFLGAMLTDFLFLYTWSVLAAGHAYDELVDCHSTGRPVSARWDIRTCRKMAG